MEETAERQSGWDACMLGCWEAEGADSSWLIADREKAERRWTREEGRGKAEERKLGKTEERAQKIVNLKALL